LRLHSQDIQQTTAICPVGQPAQKTLPTNNNPNQPKNKLTWIAGGRVEDGNPREPSVLYTKLLQPVSALTEANF